MLTAPSHILYCDAAFNPHNPKFKDAKVVSGKICISDGKGNDIVEEIVIGKVDGLKQYNNVLELTACARAVEIAIERKLTGGLRVNTDSRTAAAWAHSGVNKKLATIAHYNAQDYLLRVRKMYDGEVFIGFVPREENPAGHKLEALGK